MFTLFVDKNLQITFSQLADNNLRKKSDFNLFISRKSVLEGGGGGSKPILAYFEIGFG